MATKFLKPDKVTEIEICGQILEIKEKIIPDTARAPKDVANYCKKGEPMKPCQPIGGNGVPRGVVIHNTGDITTAAGTNPAEQYTRATWPNGNMSGAVVHFYVYKQEIWQNLKLTERGWHAGDGSARRANKRGTDVIGGNLDCIAIECIGRDPESEQTTVLLAAWLLKRFGLTVENDLYKHQFFKPSKRCPEYILPHWSAFEADVRSAMTGASAPVPAPEPVEPKKELFPAPDYTGTSVVDGLKRIKAESSFSYRKKIATVNGIQPYSGTAAQNAQMLRLLKDGKLLKP